MKYWNKRSCFPIGKQVLVLITDLHTTTSFVYPKWNPHYSGFECSAEAYQMQLMFSRIKLACTFRRWIYNIPFKSHKYNFFQCAVWVKSQKWRAILSYIYSTTTGCQIPSGVLYFRLFTAQQQGVKFSTSGMLRSDHISYEVWISSGSRLKLVHSKFSGLREFRDQQLRCS